ncbi:MAG: DUF2304 domain-containing protein [Deltaproteobacteria bacterium]|nr:DUF2304 domain-containing protein [Deltaproteobacteria bacterium]MBI3389019.1 DUF2304 domain-containing protein [Deltaproteobacteria bacterium]
MSPEPLDPDALRRFFMQQPEAFATRVLALIASLILFATVLHLVRRGRLREEYSPIWLAVAGGITLLSVWFAALRWLTRAIGAWTPSSTIFFFGELFLLAICLNYAVRLSQLANQVKSLAQELAILRSDLARDTNGHTNS